MNKNYPSYPKGLFSKIVKRLGLEKELALIKKHIRFFAVLLAIFIVLFIFAAIGVKSVLKESDFLPFFSLIFSDPGIVVKYWDSFLLSVFESTPGFAFAGFILAFAFMMFFTRIIFISIDKISHLLKLIAVQKHGNKQSV